MACYMRVVGVSCIFMAVLYITELIVAIEIKVINAGALGIWYADKAMNVAGFFIAGLLFLYPGEFRTSMRTYLLSKIEHRTAATVAGFLGGHSPEVVQNTAKQLFRALTLDKVDKQSMVRNTPDLLLLQLTVPAMLGQMDAFVVRIFAVVVVSVLGLGPMILNQ